MYAPSTQGSFLRAFTFGHVRQLQSVATQLPVNLAGQVPLLLRQPDILTFVDVLRRVYGKSKQGAGFGHAQVGGYDVRLRGTRPGHHPPHHRRSRRCARVSPSPGRYLAVRRRRRG